MKASQSLRRPNNWQDFETLCKKLWGEIWHCSEIKKNGRAGQAQNGVDIYGIPSGETTYFGIQCKGRDEYSGKQFTEAEITEEIGKAQNFKPQLKKLYFATTAVKDAKIEEFVREKNIENQTKGIFEVHLYCWEDIVELIDENKQTSDWYVKSQNYKASHSATLTFENGQNEITLEPKFKQQQTIYRKEYKMPSLDLGFSGLEQMIRFNQSIDRIIPKAFTVRTNFNTIKTNLSMVPVHLILHNTGTEALEDYKVYLELEGGITELAKRNATEKFEALIARTNYQPTTYVHNEDKTITLVPRKNVLVHDDHFYPEPFYIKPVPDCDKIIIHYKLLSRNFKTEDSLTIHIQADIDISYNRIEVEDKADERTERGEIEDFIEISDE